MIPTDSTHRISVKGGAGLTGANVTVFTAWHVTSCFCRASICAMSSDLSLPARLLHGGNHLDGALLGAAKKKSRLFDYTIICRVSAADWWTDVANVAASDQSAAA